ncbi:MAG: NfeD family protein [Pseudomonadota bacterium]
MGDFFGIEAHYAWLALGILLAIAELFVPGVFLIWVAAAALLTGVIASFVDLTFAGQLTTFGLATVASVLAGRRWYLTHDVKNEDPLLNDRAARLVGQTVTVVQAITPTAGRVKVGDSEWPARGPALEKGATAKIIDVENGVIVLEDTEPKALPG